MESKISKGLQKIINSNQISLEKLHISNQILTNPNYIVYSKSNNQIILMYQLKSDKLTKLIIYDINSDSASDFNVNFSSKEKNDKIVFPIIKKMLLTVTTIVENEKLVLFSDDFIQNQIIGYIPLKSLSGSKEGNKQKESKINT